MVDAARLIEPAPEVGREEDGKASGAPPRPAGAGALTGPEDGKATTGPRLSLSDLVERTGVPASTIHHYRRMGLLAPPDSVAANRFCYGTEHVDALRVIRRLRERQGLPLDEIAGVLPGLMALPAGEREIGIRRGGEDEPPAVRRRLLDAAIAAFEVRDYADVTVSEIAESAGVAKGTVYRHFASKEDLFTAVVEDLLDDTAGRFASAVEELGGPAGLAGDPEKASTAFATLVARCMPILLELGARAAKGHVPSELLARHVLRTLARAAGKPISETDPIPAGLKVIEAALSTVLVWAVGVDWPPDEFAE